VFLSRECLDVKQLDGVPCDCVDGCHSAAPRSGVRLGRARSQFRSKWGMTASANSLAGTRVSVPKNSI
jgi:hypothetical protein